MSQKIQTGYGMIEVIVAMAVFGMIAGAMISLVTSSFIGLERGSEYVQAENLVDEGIEAVRSIRDNAYNRMLYTTSSVSIASSAWQFDGEGTTETIGQYTRTISLTDVCRNSSDVIVTCPGDYTDPHTKLVKVDVSWEVRFGIDNIVTRSSYLTNWDSTDWLEDTLSDFNDGASFVNTATSTGHGDGDVIILTEI